MSSGLKKKYELSEDLADFMGKSSASRLEINKKLWAYIKANDLQDPDNKRVIIPDDVLETIFGPDEFDMFQMASMLSDHLL